MAILAFPAMAGASGAQSAARVSTPAQISTQVRQTGTGALSTTQVKSLEGNPRALGGFVFQPPTMLEGPFITSHIRTETAMGAVRQRAVKPDVQIPGAPTSYDLRVGALQQRTSVGVALSPNLSLGLDGGVTSYGGMNSPSALQAGSGVAFDARPGIKVGLVNDQDDGIAVALRAYGMAAQVMGSRPAGIIEARAQRGVTQQAVNAVEAGRVEMSLVGGGVSLSAAKNIGRHAGVQVEIGGEGSRVTGGNAIQGRIDSQPRTLYAGTAASIDLSPIVPVGAMVEYRMDRSVVPVAASSKADVTAGDTGQSNMHRVSAGLYYTARSNLVLGVAGTYGLARGNMPSAPATPKPARIAGGRLTVGYYF
ncbi:MAG: hypothetical protein IPM54_05530 [Polyangiaceae bacterium]|nr:hypothetical protein [Polyangiaceae bacterium]